MYVNDMEEIGNKGVVAVHAQGMGELAVVVGARVSEDNPGVKTSPGIAYYEKSPDGWKRVNGTSCDGNEYELGIANNQAIYCGLISKERPYKEVKVGNKMATLIDFGSGRKVWYAVAERDLETSFIN